MRGPNQVFRTSSLCVKILQNWLIIVGTNISRMVYRWTLGGCPRLAQGRFTLAARNEQQPTLEDATALRGGVSRCLLFVFGSAFSSQREPPRGKPVASKEGS